MWLDRREILADSCRSAMVPIRFVSPARGLVWLVCMRGLFVHSILVANPCKWFDRVRTCSMLMASRYINALEERIAFLEARLPDHAEDHFNSGPEVGLKVAPETSQEAPSEVPRSRLARRESSHQSHTGSISEDPEAEDRTSLVDGVAYLSLYASGTTDTTPEPYYVGSSSGATIARIIQSSIFRSSGSRAASQGGHGPKHQLQGARKPPAPPLSTHSDDTVSDFPDLEQARMLFDVFFERIHTRWPLLDRVVYTKLFDKQYIQGSLTIIERSIFHMIYAITARFLSLTRKPCGVDSEVSSTTSLVI